MLYTFSNLGKFTNNWFSIYEFTVNRLSKFQRCFLAAIILRKDFHTISYSALGISQIRTNYAMHLFSSLSIMYKLRNVLGAVAVKFKAILDLS